MILGLKKALCVKDVTIQIYNNISLSKMIFHVSSL